jgi:hypothetical protein
MKWGVSGVEWGEMGGGGGAAVIARDWEGKKLPVINTDDAGQE